MLLYSHTGIIMNVERVANDKGGSKASLYGGDKW